MTNAARMTEAEAHKEVDAAMPPEVVERLAKSLAARLQAHLDRDAEHHVELRRARLIGMGIGVVALLVATSSLIANAMLWRQVKALHQPAPDAPASAN